MSRPCQRISRGSGRGLCQGSGLVTACHGPRCGRQWRRPAVYQPLLFVKPGVSARPPPVMKFVSCLMRVVGPLKDALPALSARPPPVVKFVSCLMRASRAA